MPNITPEEYRNSVSVANQIVEDPNLSRYVEKYALNISRVILALDRAWREVDTCCYCDGKSDEPAYCRGCPHNKSAIAARHGLPVEGEVKK